MLLGLLSSNLSSLLSRWHVPFDLLENRLQSLCLLLLLEKDSLLVFEFLMFVVQEKILCLSDDLASCLFMLPWAKPCCSLCSYWSFIWSCFIVYVNILVGFKRSEFLVALLALPLAGKPLHIWEATGGWGIEIIRERHQRPAVVLEVWAGAGACRALWLS